MVPAQSKIKIIQDHFLIQFKGTEAVKFDLNFRGLTFSTSPVAVNWLPLFIANQPSKEEEDFFELSKQIFASASCNLEGRTHSRT